jgi:hypothetical protein
MSNQIVNRSLVRIATTVATQQLVQKLKFSTLRLRRSVIFKVKPKND